MLAAVSSYEISEWRAFEKDHGPVWLRPDWTAALIACTLGNIHRDHKRQPKPYKIEEFLIGGVSEPEQTPEQMEMIFARTVQIGGQ
jgi:hypothetical protein